MLVAMEQTHTPIATPEQRQALRRNQQQRLRRPLRLGASANPPPPPLRW